MRVTPVCHLALPRCFFIWRGNPLPPWLPRALAMLSLLWSWICNTIIFSGERRIEAEPFGFAFNLFCQCQLVSAFALFVPHTDQMSWCSSRLLAVHIRLASGRHLKRGASPYRNSSNVCWDNENTVACFPHFGWSWNNRQLCTSLNWLIQGNTIHLSKNAKWRKLLSKIPLFHLRKVGRNLLN